MHDSYTITKFNHCLILAIAYRLYRINQRTKLTTARRNHAILMFETTCRSFKHSHCLGCQMVSLISKLTNVGTVSNVLGKKTKTFYWTTNYYRYGTWTTYHSFIYLWFWHVCPMPKRCWFNVFHHLFHCIILSVVYLGCRVTRVLLNKILPEWLLFFLWCTMMFDSFVFFKL